MDVSTAKNERVDLRLSKEAKRILQNAAAIRHKSVSEFVIDSSIAAAYQAILDQQAFILDDGRWSEFMRMLDNPPKHNPGLQRLLSHKPGWKR